VKVSFSMLVTQLLGSTTCSTTTVALLHLMPTDLVLLLLHLSSTCLPPLLLLSSLSSMCFHKLKGEEPGRRGSVRAVEEEGEETQEDGH